MRQNTKNSRKSSTRRSNSVRRSFFPSTNLNGLGKKTEDGSLKLNAFSFAALNFLRIHTALIQTYEDLSQVETPYHFKDILVLAMGTFFERNPQQNIWQLDSFLTEAFLPRWKKLTATGSGV